MDSDTKKLEERLVLYAHQEWLLQERFRIECIPGELKIKNDSKGKPMEYGAVIPGRRMFPEDRDIPLMTYHEDTKTLSKPLAMVRITFQNPYKTGRGKNTNIEYVITKVLGDNITK